MKIRLNQRIGEKQYNSIIFVKFWKFQNSRNFCNSKFSKILKMWKFQKFKTLIFHKIFKILKNSHLKISKIWISFFTKLIELSCYSQNYSSYPVFHKINRVILFFTDSLTLPFFRNHVDITKTSNWLKIWIQSYNIKYIED